jgi:beta-glucosidase
MTALCGAFAFAEEGDVGIGEDTPIVKSVANVVTEEPGLRYLDSSLPIEDRVEDLFKRLTPEEKAHLLHATGGLSLGNIPRVRLENFRMLDSGNGPRANTQPGVTYFPTTIGIAATWDKELAVEVGRAMGAEARAVFPDDDPGGVCRMLLGPGLNIARSPLAARNFEYAGEDPVLCGEINAALIEGLQSRQVAACPKHWCFNDQEWCRGRLTVLCGERAAREIYLRPFEIALKKGKPWSMMNTAVMLDGIHASWNTNLNDIALREWKWDGAIITDWGVWYDDVKAMNGGTTIETNCKEDPERDRKEVDLVRQGVVSRARFEDAVRRALRLYFRVGAFDGGSESDKRNAAECAAAFRSEAHMDLAHRAAAESLVMAKNDGFLPLDGKRKYKVCIAGPNADQYHSMYDGADLFSRGGSGAIKAAREITPLEGFCEVFGRENVVFAPGMRFENQGREDAISVPGMEARPIIEAARECDFVVFCGGLDHSLDREGGNGRSLNGELSDRRDLWLKSVPGQCQEDLIREVATVNPNLVVAITCGTPVSVEEWHDKARAIFFTWYAGEFGGRVLAETVLGLVNPSGRLPFTFGQTLHDWPSHRMGLETFPGLGPMKPKSWTREWPVETYADGIWVGYRGFDHFKTKVRYPFGFGLSYTRFEYRPVLRHHDGEWSVVVRNAGTMRGREVVQCYVSKPTSPGEEMPKKELVDFASVDLAPGEERTVVIRLGEDALRHWDEKFHDWRIGAGTYKIMFGPSSDNLPVEYMHEVGK